MSTTETQHNLSTIAGMLFDQTTAAHHIPRWGRRALAHCSDILQYARSTAMDNPERAARDTLLADTTFNLKPHQRAVAACIASFQRRKLRSHREVAFISLDAKDQLHAMRLAAMLQLAGEIDQTKSTLLRVEYADHTTTITIDSIDIDALNTSAAFWREAIGALVVASAESSPSPRPTGTPLRVPSGCGEGLGVRAALIAEDLSGDESASEGSRRILRRFFERMLAREDDVLKGEDAEDVHQMRVATRRLRASLQVVENIFDPACIRRFRRGLRTIAMSLGAVRDADVFLIALREYCAALPEQAATLEALIAAVEQERSQARIALLADFQAPHYTRFKQKLAQFLTTSNAELAPLPRTGIAPRICDIAGSAIWRRYEELRSFEPLLQGAPDETLHATRIAGKRLRYTLEFFADPIGKRVHELLDQLATLQEHLGAIQDIAAAHAHIARLGMLEDQGAKHYLSHFAEQRITLINELPNVWSSINGKTYQRKLFEAIIKV
jgi:CHAD domain-containing protein